MTRRRDQADIVRQYDRVAGIYSVFEPLFLILPRTRRAAVSALGLQPGDTVVELGGGTGRNLPYLVDAVGPDGRVVLVDASAGMLAEAQQLVTRRRWRNVTLLHADAATADFGPRVDAVLFSLSYSVIPDSPRAAERAWQRLRPGCRLVVMDAGLTRSRLAPILRRVVPVLLRLGPGDPDAEPWRDLQHLGPVETRWLLADIYYICTWVKPPEAP